MRDTPDAFFSKESVPKGFSWVDPSHMQKEQMTQLLDHWQGRQEEGHVGLQFTGCARTNFKRNDYRRKTREYQEDDEKNPGKAEKGQFSIRHLGDGVDRPVVPIEDPANPVDPVDPVDLVDPTPFSMLHKSAEEKIGYLRRICMDKNYQDMIDALANSDKVRCFSQSLTFANIIIGF